jgi:5-methylcytosine-specific restriction enzyme subunit McrC
VVPKLAGENLGLVQMIQFLGDLGSLRRMPGTRDFPVEDHSLLDFIALLFAEACDRLLRGGLVVDYTEREEDLAVVRGRILADRQILRRFGQIDRVACRFDEQDHDTLDNRLLGATLRLCRPRVVDETVRRRLATLQAIFEQVCTPELLDLATARGDLFYHRLNEHYRDAHTLAWLLLDGLGVKDLLAPGDTSCFAFLIDMNRLFERFVHRLVERLLGRGSWLIKYQRADPSIVWNADTDRPYSRVIPDLLVEDSVSGARLAIDAKYKRYDERKLTPGDIYQSFLYAYAYSAEAASRVPRAVLVYPAETGSVSSTRLRIRSAARLVAAEIIAVGIPIPAALREASHGERGQVSRALLEVLTVASR